MERAVPGPFDSEKTKGSFHKDVSSIRQNDVWSSATINNFVETLYKLYRMESAYRDAYKNSGQEIGERMFQESTPPTPDRADGSAFSLIPDIHFKVKQVPEDGTGHGYVYTYPATRPAPGSDPNIIPPDDSHLDDQKSWRLFFGTGDVSLHAKPYALFPVKRPSSGNTTQILAVGGSGTANDDRYCCIQYVYGTPTPGESQFPQDTATPRYSRTVELVLVYHPGIDSQSHLITSEFGTSEAEGTPPVKFTMTFGKGATVADLKARLEALRYGLTIDPDSNIPVFKVNIVGANPEDTVLLVDTGLFADGVINSTKPVSSVLRFVPLRPCVSFAGGPKKYLEALTRWDEDSEFSLTEFTGTLEGGDAVFLHTGTYGFLIPDTLAESPSYVSANDAPLIYLPNKVNTHHYEPAQDTDTTLPTWYTKLVSKSICMAHTQNFSSDYYFVPYITITDRTIEIAGFIIDIDTLLTLGDVTTELVPGSYSPDLLESNVTYDAWWARNNASSKPLFDAADQIYKKYRKGLGGVYKNPTHPELSDLEMTSPRPNSLIRTLQIMTGLTWQLSNIVWIDPMLRGTPTDEDPLFGDKSAPALRMFSGYEAIFYYEDTYTGPGTILTPDTLVVYLVRLSSREFSLQVITLPTNRLLPEGMKHMALGIVDEDLLSSKVTDEDFTLGGWQMSEGLFLQPTGSGGLVSSAENRLPLSEPGVYSLVNQDFSMVDYLAVSCKDMADFGVRIDLLNIVGGRYRGFSSQGTAAVNICGDAEIQGPVYTTEAEAHSANRLWLSQFTGATIIRASYLVFSRLGSVKKFSGTFTPVPTTREPVMPRWASLVPHGLVALGPTDKADIDLTLKFSDYRSNSSDQLSNLHILDRSTLKSVIDVQGQVCDSRITIRISDSGNQHKAVVVEGTNYDVKQWQAFDPDILFPVADPVENPFSDSLLFINCGLPDDNKERRAPGQFVNSKLVIDLRNDFKRQEPADAFGTSPVSWRYRTDCQFFASRFFRLSPYLMYFGSDHPVYYWLRNEAELGHLTRMSEDVDLSFLLPEDSRLAVRYDLRLGSKGEIVAPKLPEVEYITLEGYLVTYQGQHIFISGLKNSRIQIPSLFCPSVVKHNETVPESVTDTTPYRTYFHKGLPGTSANVLFEALTGCDIRINSLDTTYPLRDEWQYNTADYAEEIEEQSNVVGWGEPNLGFLFFTRPTYDCRVNVNNTLYVAQWKTRQLVSGILGLHDSKVDIHYMFTTQSSDLNWSNGTDPEPGIDPGPQGPSRWDLDAADPGGEKKFIIETGERDVTGKTVCYLPATPLFYLAETYSCNIRLTQAIDNSGFAYTVPLNGTQDIDLGDSSTGMRYQYQRFNNVPDFTPKDLYSNRVTYFRPLRLAVGWAFPRTSDLSGVWAVAPSSYNTIYAHITRANLVAGAMNRVTGWCYRLFSTKASDFIPERYHYSGTWDYSDLHDPQMQITGVGSGGLVSNRPSRYADDPDHGFNQGLLDPDPFPALAAGELEVFMGTVKPRAVTKELTFDLTAPSMHIYESEAILRALSFLHADYPVLGQDPQHSGSLTNTTLANKNAVVHASSKELGYSGFSLMVPGYSLYGSPSGDTQHAQFDIHGAFGIPSDDSAKGYAGLIYEPSCACPNPQATHAPNVAGYCAELNWTYDDIKKYQQRTPMVDALNTVSLDVLLIATSQIYYVRNSMAGGKDPRDLLDGAVFKNWTIEPGQLLHTVIAQGWVAGLPENIIEEGIPVSN